MTKGLNRQLSFTMNNQDYKKQPLVSIIMNCFNGEKYLKYAIDSIISQTYKNWEIIFWDNRSNDNSKNIFKSYNDDRLKYFCSDYHEKILYKAKNHAVRKANGEFIAFLDVDDWWLPEKLEKQIPLFEDQKVGLVYGNAWQFFEKNNKKKIYKKGTLPTGNILNELMKNYVISSPTYVIRKKSLNSLEYFFNDNFHIIGDFDICLRLAVKWRIDCIQLPLAYIRKHDNNLSLLNREREINEIKVWYQQMQDNHLISSQSNFDQVLLTANYLESMKLVMENKFLKSFSAIAKYPFCFNKIKLVLALLIPKFLLKKIKNY